MADAADLAGIVAEQTVALSRARRENARLVDIVADLAFELYRQHRAFVHVLEFADCARRQAQTERDLLLEWRES